MATPAAVRRPARYDQAMPNPGPGRPPPRLEARAVGGGRGRGAADRHRRHLPAAAADHAVRSVRGVLLCARQRALRAMADDASALRADGAQLARSPRDPAAREATGVGDDGRSDRPGAGSCCRRPGAGHRRWSVRSWRSGCGGCRTCSRLRLRAGFAAAPAHAKRGPTRIGPLCCQFPAVDRESTARIDAPDQAATASATAATLRLARATGALVAATALRFATAVLRVTAALLAVALRTTARLAPTAFASRS